MTGDLTIIKCSFYCILFIGLSKSNLNKLDWVLSHSSPLGLSMRVCQQSGSLCLPRAGKIPQSCSTSEAGSVWTFHCSQQLAHSFWTQCFTNCWGWADCPMRLMLFAEQLFPVLKSLLVLWFSACIFLSAFLKKQAEFMFRLASNPPCSVLKGSSFNWLPFC